MPSSPNTVLRACFEHVLEQSDPRRRIAAYLSNISDELPDSGPIAVFSVGKAAVGMLWGVHDVFGGRLATGLAIAKHRSAVPPCCDVVVGDHPLPGERSAAAGRRAIEFAEGMRDEMSVIVCVSGGGSALMVSPVDGVTVDEITARTNELLKSGANIRELNAVRSRLDRLKGGGLAGHLPRGVRPAHLLVISDIVGDPLDLVASGPFAVDDIHHQLVSGVTTALSLARERAAEFGYAPMNMTSRMTGEAKTLGASFARELIEWSGPRPACLSIGGESTVTVTGGGLGGPNLEFALGAAKRLDGIEGITVGTLTTDGEDGPTDAAGAIVDGFTVARAREFGFDVDEALANNDSYPLLDAIGALVKTGPTGNNINDIALGLVE